MNRVERTARQVHRRLLTDAADDASGFTDVESEPAIAALGRDAVVERVRRTDPLLGSDLVAAAADAVLAHASGLGRLAQFSTDDAVSEIMVNGDGTVWLERRGRLERTGLCLDHAEVHGIIERVLAPLGLRADRRRPITDARLADGSRLHVVLPPVAVDGPCLTIRRFRLRPVGLRAFCPAPVARLLAALVHRRCNVLVSGGTGAGKTTLLNALAAEVGAEQRVVTIEDTAELRLPGEHVVRLEARPASAEAMGSLGGGWAGGPGGGPGGNVDGLDATGAVDIGALVRTALRMRPDRIIVGEVRGSEALAMLAAMNTGHEGSLSTLHANSAPDALSRLETMVLGSSARLPLGAVRQHVRAAIDVVVQVARTDGQDRQVVAVEEVIAGGGPEDAVLTVPLVEDGTVVRAPTRWRRVTPPGA
jgi:pilus assembly protein CpaF